MSFFLLDRVCDIASMVHYTQGSPPSLLQMKVQLGIPCQDVKDLAAASGKGDGLNYTVFASI